MTTGQPVIDKPADLEALRALLLARRDLFTPKMLAAGAFAIDNPQVVALNPVSELARIAGLAPTSFVRLAQAMGFAGFSEMQALFRAPLRRAIPPTLGERIRHALGEQVVADPDDPAALGRSFAEANIASLRHLADRMDALPLDGAIDLITAARMIYVIGVDRSFPTAAYLSYALNRAGLQSAQITGLGRAMRDHARAMRAGDLLIAISFPPYAPETVEVVRAARARGRDVLAITDSAVSPITDGARHTLPVEDAALHGFRSLTAVMCLAQTLAMGVAYRQRRAGDALDIDDVNA